MHELEPHYNWRNHYVSEDDPGSPFFEQDYNEQEDQEQYQTGSLDQPADPNDQSCTVTRGHDTATSLTASLR